MKPEVRIFHLYFSIDCQQIGIVDNWNASSHEAKRTINYQPLAAMIHNKDIIPLIIVRSLWEECNKRNDFFIFNSTTEINCTQDNEKW